MGLAMRIGVCVYCNGNGIDDADWSGRCSFCDGYGNVDEYENEYSFEDDDNFDDENE